MWRCSARASEWFTVQPVPSIGQQFLEPAVGPAGRELAQHVGEIRQRRHAVLGTCAHDAAERSGAVCRVVRAREEEVLAAESHVAHLLLADIVVGRKPSVVKEARERRPMPEAIAHRLRQVTTRRLSFRCDHEPAFQSIEHVLGSFVAQGLPLGRCPLLQVGQILETVEAPDQL